ncbi:hypothetical protein [Parerythrobacter aestuarii]|uniref:hypothetical protein n=1 Tax=Parerythrobacter aestuarii TaxID=3020909 RepID=UPI0024DEF7F9|nr:hypothetical protein [Parerythrobacter aestuarii]
MTKMKKMSVNFDDFDLGELDAFDVDVVETSAGAARAETAASCIIFSCNGCSCSCDGEEPDKVA